MARLLVIITFSISSLLWAQTPALTEAEQPVSRIKNFKVAESAFLNSDLFKAEYLFKDLIKDKVWDDEAFKSLDRLITIAQVNGDKNLFADIISTIKDINDSANMAYYSLLYNLGKYLFHEGNYKLALTFLDKIEGSTPYYPRVLYIKAACLGSAKKYKEAILIFEQIIKTKDVDSDLKELAVLGKARIFMITKRYNKALSEYQSISQWSPYYLDSLKEIARVFLATKDYDNAILHLETLAFVNSKLYITDKNDKNISTNETLTDFDLMNLKTIQGYIYMEQGRFEEASQVFNEIILSYTFIKKSFAEQINKLKVSDDITQLVSHPDPDGTPKSLITNASFVLFDTGNFYSTAFREWLTYQEKSDLIKYLSVYYSILNRTDKIDPGKVLPEEVIRLVALRNLMNKYLKTYIGLLIKRINARLDDVGLRAQLGKIDITWKTKENQSKKIKEIQEQKQEYIDQMDDKYKRLVE